MDAQILAVLYHIPLLLSKYGRRVEIAKPSVVQCACQRMKHLSSLSIFFPSLNDAKILPYLIARAHTAAQKVTRNFEVIVVDDGSTDNTKEILRELCRHYPHLRIVTHHANKGYGGALKSGFRVAKKDWVFYTDGDGQYDPMELTRLVGTLTPTTDVVNGYKTKRADTIVRTLIGFLYNLATQTLYHPPIRDIDCDFRLIRRKNLTKISLTSTSGIICVELITKLYASGARFAETPISHYVRRFGRSQFFQWKHIYQTLVDYATNMSSLRN